MSAGTHDLLGGRYHEIRMLAEGGMGQVLLVEDTFQQDRPVALKILPASWITKAALESFRREFQVMRTLHHPNLVEVYDFGSLTAAREGYFFTLEHVDGVDAFRATERSDPGQIFDLLVQVCRGLAYLHGHGLLHLDVKPANIVVDRSAGVMRAKLVDFGLAQAGLGHRVGKLRGTLSHMAPEVCMGGALDERTDLYSLGVTLYELATRRLPFIGSSTAELLEAHQRTVPTSPREIDPRIPEGLQAIVMKLLAKSPDERYADALEVIEAVSELSSRAYDVEPRSSMAASLRSRGLIGRDAEFAQLEQAWSETVQHGMPCAIQVMGDLGWGRSRLLSHLAETLQLQAVSVLTCGAPRGLLGRMFPVLSGSWALASPGVRERMGSSLDQLLAGETPAPETLAEARANFARLLLLVAEERPLAVIVDDVEDLPSSAREALRVLLEALILETSSDIDCRLLLVLSSEEASGLDELQMSGSLQFRELHLQPLDEQSVGDLIVDILGTTEPVPGDLVARIRSETGGIPFLVEESLRALLARGVLRRSGLSWHFGVVQPEDLQDLGSAEEIVTQRLGDLSESARDIAGALAVAARPVAESDLLTVLTSSGVSNPLTLDPGAVALELGRLAQRGVIVGLRGQHETDRAWSVAHGAFSRGLITSVPEERVAALHGSFAELATVAGDSHARAWHLLNSPDIATGARAAIEHARGLTAKGLRSEAARILERVLERAGEILPASERSQVRFDLGYAYILIGQPRKAAEQLQVVFESTDTAPQLRIEAGVRRATLAQSRGDFKAAESFLEPCMVITRSDLPEAEQRGVIFELLCHLGMVKVRRQRLDEAAEILESLEEQVGLTPKDERRAYLFHLFRCWFHRVRLDADKQLESASALARAQIQMQGYESPLAYGNLAHAFLSAGRYREALDIYHDARVWAEERFLLTNMVPYLVNEGMVLASFLSEPNRARPLLERARHIAGLLGRKESQAIAFQHLAEIEARAGRYGRALELVDSAIELRHATESRRASESLAIKASILLEIGEHQRCEETCEQALELDKDSRSEHHESARMVRARSWLAQGRTEPAAAEIEEILATTSLSTTERIARGYPLRLAELAMARGRGHAAAGSLYELHETLAETPLKEVRAQTLLLSAVLGEPQGPRVGGAGRARAGLDVLEHAAELLRGVPAVDLRARILVEMAAAASAMGDEPAASGYMARAWALLEPALGSLPDGAMREAFLAVPWRRRLFAQVRGDFGDADEIVALGDPATSAFASPLDGAVPAPAEVHAFMLETALGVSQAARATLLRRRGRARLTLVATRGQPQATAAASLATPAEVEAALGRGVPTVLHSGAELAVVLPLREASPDLPPGSPRPLQRSLALVLERPAQNFAEVGPLQSLLECLERYSIGSMLLRDATFDAGTGLGNRQFFDRALDHYAYTAASGAALSLGLIGYEQLRRTRGRELASGTVATAAGLVLAELRPRDTVARYGEDEIVVFLPGVEADEARSVADRILRAGRSHRWADGAEMSLAIGISVGPEDSDEPQALVDCARMAMAEARHAPEGCTLRWTPGLTTFLERGDELLFGVVTGDPLRDYRNIRTLLDILELTVAEESREVMLPRVLDRIVSFTGAERAILFLDRGAAGLQPELIQTRDDVLDRNRPWSRSIPAQVFETRQPVLTMDAMDSVAGKTSQSVLDLELRTLMCAALEGRSRVLGVLYVDGHGGSRQLLESDLTFFHALTREVARALELAELRSTAREKQLLDRDLQIAADVHARLLPSEMPAIEGMEIAARTVSARELGGDYFDVFAGTPQGGCTAVLGDVSGKGVGAALLVAMAKGILAVLLQEELGAVEVLKRLSTELVRLTRTDQFMSMGLIEWKVGSDTIRCAGGAQEHLLVARADGSLTVKRVGGALLGIGMGMENLLEEWELPLAPGDTVLMYSDGVTDCRNADGEDFSLAALQESLVRAARAPTVAEVIECILADVQAHRRNVPLTDDVTMMALRRK